jgi:hypothetical protein
MRHLSYIVLATALIFSLSSCKKVEEYNQDPELIPLKHGFQVSNTIAYCVSLANTLMKGEELPSNVVFETHNTDGFSGSGIMYVDINSTYPLPYNENVGQIVMGVLWNENGGVVTAAFSDIDIIENKYKFIGIETIPIIEMSDGRILTLYAEQDIVIGEGMDTALHINMSSAQFQLELNRLDAIQPTESTAVVQQNVWFVNIDTGASLTNIYDDELVINGGGQIVSVESHTGGVLYHAMIGVESCFNSCGLNPVDGIGFIQNLKSGDKTDLGHVTLSFHNSCDGKAFVEAAAGKYLGSNRKDVTLNF